MLFMVMLLAITFPNQPTMVVVAISLAQEL
jgi:hypothetical protein